MSTWPPRRRPRLASPGIVPVALLDSLPPVMMDEILSRLTLCEAARTSVLSRSWRRRWESVPYLVLNWPRGTPSAPIETVLAHSTRPIREFRHQYVLEPEFSLSDLWLLRLASVGVQSLYLKFMFKWLKADGVWPIPQSHMLHSSIFSCHGVAVLALEGCDIPDPLPCFAGFPNLTNLSLTNVGFPQGARGLEVLISSASSLQSLRLENLRMPDESEQWVIHAPSLQRLFVLSVDDYGWQIDDLPSLEAAEIRITDYSDDRDFVNLISRLDQARILQLSLPFSDDDANVVEGLTGSFENLTSLSLYIPMCSLSSISSIFYLLRNAPKLAVLDIEYNDYVAEHEEGEEDIDLLIAQFDDDVFPSLTSVRMKNVIWDLNEMLFMELVLANARQLEAFTVCQSSHPPRSAFTSMAEMVQCTKASPGANIVFNYTSSD